MVGERTNRNPALPSVIPQPSLLTDEELQSDIANAWPEGIFIKSTPSSHAAHPVNFLDMNPQESETLPG